MQTFIANNFYSGRLRSRDGKLEFVICFCSLTLALSLVQEPAYPTTTGYLRFSPGCVPNDTLFTSCRCEGSERTDCRRGWHSFDASKTVIEFELHRIGACVCFIATRALC